MISFHPLSEGAATGTIFTRGFRYAAGIDLRRAAKGMARFAWSPACFKDGYRREDNFQMAELVALDFDSGEMSLDEAVSVFCDTEHVIGTTRSHQVSKNGGPAVDRFRVVLRLEEPIVNLQDYRETLRRLLYRYPADPAAKDGARFFFPCRNIVSICDDGYLEPIKKADPERVKKRIEARRDAGVLSQFTAWVLSNVIPKGGRNTMFYRVAKDLLRLGKTEEEVFLIIVECPTQTKTPSSERLSEREVWTIIKSAKRGLVNEQS